MMLLFIYTAPRFTVCWLIEQPHKKTLHLQFRIQMFNSATMIYSYKFMND